MEETIEIQVLLSGYVKEVETWGSDQRIVEAARMSTNKGFVVWGDGEKPGDERLLKYLYTNKHMTPFEMAGLVIEVKAPIFVFREWHRHRTQSYNEMSARYIPLPDENYIPTIDDVITRASAQTRNKQAQGAAGVVPDEWMVSDWLERLEYVYQAAQQVYEEGIEMGIPKEIARLPVPVARFSRMRASANLRNWFGFLSLRMDPAAQQEIRVCANAVGEIIKARFPRSWELFAEEE